MTGTEKLPPLTKEQCRGIALRVNARIHKLRKGRKPEPWWAMSEEYKDWLRSLDFTEDEIADMDMA